LRDELSSRGAFGDLRGELSMGMTHDYEIAIAKAQPSWRVGTAIFLASGKKCKGNARGWPAKRLCH